MSATQPNDSAATIAALAQTRQLRTELVDLAFTLERRGRLDAADVINAVVSRLAEIEAGAMNALAHAEVAP